MVTEKGQRSRESVAGDVPLDVIPIHSSNLLTVLDEEGRIRYESPAIERIFGYDQDELMGDEVASYFHPDDRENVLKTFETVVASDDAIVESIEYRHQRADGSFRWVESVVSADPTPSGDYVVNTRDIADRKRRERELRDQNELLEEFASVVSHDLRNPLNIVAGRLELGRGEHDNEHFEAAAAALDRMEQLIDDLLVLAREGSATSDIEPVDLATVCKDSWRFIESIEATLETDFEGEILADRNRLRQLLENLFRNAIEHGGESVTVSVGRVPAGFYVEDDGPGIPPDKRESVFDAGFSTSETGTGFGLRIVDQMADVHEWQLSLTESTRGGARFEITGVSFEER